MTETLQQKCHFCHQVAQFARRNATDRRNEEEKELWRKWKTVSKLLYYRITCPDSATLGNYHLGLLGETAIQPIANHLDVPLSAEIEQLEVFLLETAVFLQPSTGERMRVDCQTTAQRWANQTGPWPSSRCPGLCPAQQQQRSADV